MQTGAFPHQQGKYPALLTSSNRLNTQLKVTLAPLDPDLRPKGALLRLSIGTPASGGHPDPAAGQAPVFCRAAEEFDGRCVYLFPWLIHVDPRHCSCAVDAWATLIRGTPPSGLDPSLNSVRPRARPWRTRSPLRGCYWSALPGARHAALLTPKAHGRGEVRHRG